ncbi:MAG: glycosyltransferase family 87 protein [Bradyrhizobium sp.]
MATSLSVPTLVRERSAIPAALFNVCFVLFVINAAFFPIAYFAGWWIFDPNGQGIPTDFVNVWSAGRLVLDHHPAKAYDWDIQKQVQVAVLGQTYPGNFAWHYPPPFLFIAALLAQFSYAVAFIGWAAASFVPYLAVMRATVGKPFGWLLAAAFPVVFSNVLVGQNGFLTAALIGGTLYFMPMRPILAGICLGLLSYKPQYGLLFPIALIAASQWTTFVTAAVVAVAMAFASWLAFGTESWQAFLHWMPMFSQAFLTEGRAPWWKLQSLFALVRYFGGSEQLGWILQWIMTGTVTASLIVLWRSSVRYSLKAAALAAGTVLTTPYLFMYDMMVLAIPVAWLVRIGVAGGFRTYELPALAVAAALTVGFILFGLPLGLGAALIVLGLIMARCSLRRGVAMPLASAEAGWQATGQNKARISEAAHFRQ